MNDDATFNHHDLLGSISITDPGTANVAASTTVYAIDHARSITNSNAVYQAQLDYDQSIRITLTYIRKPDYSDKEKISRASIQNHTQNAADVVLTSCVAFFRLDFFSQKLIFVVKPQKGNF